ncbi:MAG: hypothetical protein IJ708_06935 [Clostridia bacterium]|nr:hypothetical protein [Clostridia bacterium]MBR2287655.1 hypothetical protein [Clostridia bacterium]
MSYVSLSPEARVLVAEAAAHLASGYDPATGIVTETMEGQPYRSVRNSMYYALALLLEKGQAGTEEAEKIIRAVLALQFTDPSQIYYGTFRHPDDPQPPRLPLPWQTISPEARYIADMSWERVTGAFSDAMQSDPALASHAGDVSLLLEKTLRQIVPVVWDTYEPNLREFIGMTFAMVLEHFAALLSPDLVHAVRESCLALTEGAIARLESGLTPYNTNVRIMLIFLLDFFGTRLSRPEWTELALKEMEKLTQEYAEFHAVAEFNSPTYCGVDLSTLGFFRRYSANPSLIRLADQMENGIWHDMAAFYNPAMRAFCGPYSRCYELDMAIHTCFYDILFLGLGKEKFPLHPFSIESVINPLTVLGDIRIPGDVAELFLSHERHATVLHRYRELAERGDPTLPQAVCTTSAVIHPTLMYGAMRGSLNPSHQLHPLVIFWRHGEALSTLRLLRALPDGSLGHLHVVRFDGQAEEGRITMEVINDSPHDVLLRFDLDLPGARPEETQITEDIWQLPGLTLAFKAHPKELTLRTFPDSPLSVCYPLKRGEQVRFDILLKEEE